MQNVSILNHWKQIIILQIKTEVFIYITENMLINLNLPNFTFVYMNAYLQRMLVLTYMKQIILS